MDIIPAIIFSALAVILVLVAIIATIRALANDGYGRTPTDDNLLIHLKGTREGGGSEWPR